MSDLPASADSPRELAGKPFDSPYRLLGCRPSRGTHDRRSREIAVGVDAHKTTVRAALSWTQCRRVKANPLGRQIYA